MSTTADENPHDWPDPWPEWADALAALADLPPRDIPDSPPF